VRSVRRAPGQALVEAAVSFPLLVLLLLAVVEGALYVHALHVVLGAAREGAHAAATERATVEGAVDAGRDRAREVLDAGLGQYADALQVSDPVLDGGNVVVEIHGGMPLFFGGPGQSVPVQIPIDARARASREFFRPQGAEGY
jgi:Flp pilus assembly protein TadG